MTEWVIPTVEAGAKVFEHRNEIRNAWQRFVNKFNKKTRIVVLGMPGVGKTVLLDYISDRAYYQGYQPPTRPSQSPETGITYFWQTN